MDYCSWSSLFDSFWLDSSINITRSKNQKFVASLRPDSAVIGRNASAIAELKNIQLLASRSWDHPDFIKLLVMMRQWVSYNTMLFTEATCYGYLVAFFGTLPSLIVFPFKMSCVRKGSFCLLCSYVFRRRRYCSFAVRFGRVFSL